MVVTTSAPKSPIAAPITEAPDTGRALAAARAQGTEVEAVSMRTSMREVFAQPDGNLQARLSTVPKRVQRAGQWVDIDPSLAVDGDGVATRATEAGITFSRGGSAEPLVRLSREGKSFAITWPGELPAPILEGPVATYREVLPGVDLRLTAMNDGYQQLLVVKSRAAAKHVTAVKLGLQTSGLTVKPGEQGAFDLVDAAGKAVFKVPSSLMWDSKKQNDPETPRTDHAPVGVEFGDGLLTLTPDQKLLTDPDTVYPIYIDPDGRVVNHDGAWTVVYDNGTAKMREGKHWQGKNQEAETEWWVKVDPTARSGRAPQTPGPLLTRSYFQFNTSFLEGKDVHKARLDATVVHASTACNVDRWHKLHRAGAKIAH